MLLDVEESQLVLVDYQERLMPAMFEAAAVLDNAHRLARMARLLDATRLTAEQRRLAPQLVRALRELPDAATARTTLEAAGFRIDYLEDRALGTSHAAASRRYIAAFLGETRLIDNVALD